MCLSIPARILGIDNNTARVSIGGTTVNADLSLVDDVSVGDYILVHTGFALQKISEEEARATMELFREYEEFNRQLDKEEGKHLDEGS